MAGPDAAADSLPKDTARARADEPYRLLQMLMDVFHPRNIATPTNIAYVFVAAMIYWISYPIGIAKALIDTQAPALDHMPWIGSLVGRNLLMTTIVYETWHYLLYVKDPPISDKKINPKMPPDDQHLKCAVLTLVGSVIASTYEVIFILGWASGRLSYNDSFFADPVILIPKTILLLVLAGYISDFHFYVVHRMMHPWWNAGRIDPGAFMYRQFHSVHHMSVNPGPWSGLAMHPVEHIIYLSRSLWIPFVSAHPIVFLFTNVRAILGPAPGHHGFEDNMGSRFHNIHHSKFRCNYGTHGYIDRYLGTFDTGDKGTPTAVKDSTSVVLPTQESLTSPGSKKIPSNKRSSKVPEPRRRLTKAALAHLDRGTKSPSTLQVPRLIRASSALSVSSVGSTKSENRRINGVRISDL